MHSASKVSSSSDFERTVVSKARSNSDFERPVASKVSSSSDFERTVVSKVSSSSDFERTVGNIEFSRVLAGGFSSFFNLGPKLLREPNI